MAHPPEETAAIGRFVVLKIAPSCAHFASRGGQVVSPPLWRRYFKSLAVSFPPLERRCLEITTINNKPLILDYSEEVAVDLRFLANLAVGLALWTAAPYLARGGTINFLTAALFHVGVHAFLQLFEYFFVTYPWLWLVLCTGWIAVGAWAYNNPRSSHVQGVLRVPFALRLLAIYFLLNCSWDLRTNAEMVALLVLWTWLRRAPEDEPGLDPQPDPEPPGMGPILGVGACRRLLALLTWLRRAPEDEPGLDFQPDPEPPGMGPILGVGACRRISRGQYQRQAESYTARELEALERVMLGNPSAWMPLVKNPKDIHRQLLRQQRQRQGGNNTSRCW